MIGWLVYPLFVALGAVVSYEDWRERKIRNRWILAGFALGALCLGYLALNSALGYRGVRLWASYKTLTYVDLGQVYMPWQYYARVALHMLLSFACSYALWRYSVWPAGDAKLFIVFALLLPLAEPNLPGFPRMLFVVMLINVFVPAGLVLSVETLARLLMRVPSLTRIEWAKEAHAWCHAARVRLNDHWPHRYNFLALSINLFSFFTAFRLFQRWLIGAAGGPAGRLVIFAGLALTWGRVQRLLCDHRLGAGALCALAAAALTATLRLHADVLAWLKLGVAMMFNFGMFLSAARVVLGALAEKQSLGTVAPEEVRPGMILAEPTWQALRREPALVSSLGHQYCDGLTDSEAAAVRGWVALEGSKGKIPACHFYRAVPFAIWIFLGSLLTFKFRSTALHSLMPALHAGWAAARRAAPWWSL